MVIRNAVQCGEIQQAIERTNAVDPAILAGDPELSFKLKQQQLVELIRSGGVEEALTFAQAELSPLAEGGPAPSQGACPRRSPCRAARCFQKPRVLALGCPTDENSRSVDAGLRLRRSGACGSWAPKPGDPHAPCGSPRPTSPTGSASTPPSS